MRKSPSPEEPPAADLLAGWDLSFEVKHVLVIFEAHALAEAVDAGSSPLERFDFPDPLKFPSLSLSQLI